MSKKPTYEELEQRVKELEKEAAERKGEVRSKEDKNECGLSNESTNIEHIVLEILKTIPATLNVVDTDFNILMVGGEIVRTFENIDQIIGKKCHKVFQKRDSPCPWCRVNEVIKTGVAIDETTTPDDPREKVVKKPLSVYVRPLKDNDGNIIGAIELATDITQITEADEQRKRAEEKLLIYQEQLRSLASELSFAEERERRRFATDLHDSIGQALAISKIKLDALRSAAPLAPVTGDLDEVRELIREAIQQTRSLTYDLSPPALYQFGLEAALESLVERMEELHGIRVHLTDDKQPKPLSEDLAVILFRSVQELLVNIVKHAQTQNARVSIRRDGDHLQIKVEDDGVGFNVSEIDSYVDRAGRFGLFSIAERLRHLGARFEVVSKPGHGTQVTLIAPLASTPITMV